MKVKFILILIAVSHILIADDFVPDVFPVEKHENAFISRTIEEYELIMTNSSSIPDAIRINQRENIINIIATCFGIVKRVASYEKDDFRYYEITISNPAGFKAIFTGLSDVFVEVNDYVGKGHIIGQKQIENRNRNELFEYKIQYLGRIINPEVLLFLIDQNDYTLEELLEHTEEIVNLNIELKTHHLEGEFINYEDHVLSFHQLDSYYRTYLGEPLNDEIIQFSTENPEYDIIRYTYEDGYTTSRVRINDYINSMIIQNPNDGIAEIKIGSTVDEIYGIYGMPFRIMFNGPQPSQKVAKYILMTNNSYKENIRGIDYCFTNDENETINVLVDIEYGAAKTIHILDDLYWHISSH